MTRQISKDGKEEERGAFTLSIFPRTLDKYRYFDGRGLLKVIFFGWISAVRRSVRIDKVTSCEAVRKACENVVRKKRRGEGGSKNTRYPGQLRAANRFTTVFAWVVFCFDPDRKYNFLGKGKEGTEAEINVGRVERLKVKFIN